MRNLASIELGRHLVWDGTNHQLYFTAAETKNDRAYAAAMPQNLTTYVYQALNVLEVPGRPLPAHDGHRSRVVPDP